MGSSFVPPEERETAVVIVIDVAGLDAVYREEFPAFHSLGIPLHATLRYPFVRPDHLDAALPRLTEVLKKHHRFDFSLTELKTFPRTIWVAPDPAAPFIALTEAIEAAFPETPQRAFAEVIPHVTLVDGVDESRLAETVQRLRRVVEPLLPATLSAEEVVVLAEQEDGRMPVVARLPLGGDSSGTF
ncbi:MAG TPA: 2'-5' RNA ligase family protein [Gaiellaceae bacterium]